MNNNYRGDLNGAEHRRAWCCLDAALHALRTLRGVTKLGERAELEEAIAHLDNAGLALERARAAAAAEGRKP